MIKPRLALFKWRHFESDIIVCAFRWYLRFSLSYRDVEELIMERGLPADYTTIWLRTQFWRITGCVFSLLDKLSRCTLNLIDNALRLT
jgi:hypothetical protein